LGSTWVAACVHLATMTAIGQDWSYQGRAIDGSIGARLIPRASGRASITARAKENAEKSHAWDKEKSLSLERAWNSKFAKRDGDMLGSSSLPRTARRVTCSAPRSGPLAFGVSSLVPASEVCTDRMTAPDFPVWSSHQNYRNYYSPRGLSVPTTRPRFGVAEQPTTFWQKGAMTGYVMPASTGGKSLYRFMDSSTPGATPDRSLPVGLSALTPGSINTHTTRPEHFSMLLQRQRLAQDYPSSLHLPKAGLSAADTQLDVQDRGLQRAQDNVKAERKFLDGERLNDGVPNIWTERGKAVHDEAATDATI